MLSDLIFTEFLGGCVETAGELGYDVTLGMARGAISEEAVYRRSVRNTRVDAMIVSTPLVADPRPELLASLGMPFIVHGRTQSPAPYAHLDIDNYGAFHSATRLLLDLGHRRIALINGECRHTYAADRKRGFIAAMADRDLAPDHQFMCEATMREDIAFRQASALLAHAAPPSAFLCSSIGQALGVIRACREVGRNPGRDIAIIAHDDRLPELRAETIDPPLTTTQSSIGDAGRRVVELAVGLLRDPNAPMPSEVWPVDLVVRGSTPPAG